MEVRAYRVMTSRAQAMPTLYWLVVTSRSDALAWALAWAASTVRRILPQISNTHDRSMGS